MDHSRLDLGVRFVLVDVLDYIQDNPVNIIKDTIGVTPGSKTGDGFGTPTKLGWLPQSRQVGTRSFKEVKDGMVYEPVASCDLGHDTRNQRFGDIDPGRIGDGFGLMFKHSLVSLCQECDWITPTGLLCE